MGEATEVALRVLAEKVGLPGYADMPGSMEHLSKRERATFCNDFWQQENRRVSLRCFLPLLPHGPFPRCAHCMLLLARQHSSPHNAARPLFGIDLPPAGPILYNGEDSCQRLGEGGE